MPVRSQSSVQLKGRRNSAKSMKKQREVDEDGHAVTTKKIGGTPLLHGRMDS